MKKNALLVIIIFAAFTMKAQQPDNLEPDASVLTDFDHSVNYNLLIRKYLFDSLSTFPIARTLVCPSFSPEYMISFEAPSYNENKPNTGNENILMIFRTCDTSIWELSSNNKISSIRVKNKELYVDYAFANLIESLFKKAIFQASFKDSFMGIDGTEYYYIITEMFKGIHCAKVWSPGENTKMFALTQISELLKEYAETNEQKIKNEIINKANDLLIRLERNESKNTGKSIQIKKRN